MRQQLFDTAAFAHRGGRASPAPLLPATGRLFDPAPFAATRPATAQSVSSTMGGTQQKMFMTPREIHAGWSPLDADREASYEGGTYEGSYQPKSWDTGNTMPGTYRNTESTGTAPLATAGYTQQQRRVPGIHSGEGGDDTGTIRRTRGGGKYRLYGRGQDDTESDDQLWDRKLEESQEFGKHGQHEDAASDPLHRGGRGSSTMGTYQGEPTGASQGTPSDSAYDRHYARENSWENRRQEARYDQGESLYDSIAFEGVRGPIRLGQQIGSMGKPQIVGGHHRLAAASDIDPHRLVPVLHDWSIHSAREEARRGGYPYA